MKILIVEDEVIAANYLRKVLAITGYEVIEIINTGAHAIEVAKKEKPDIIFMDIMLKDHISGAEAAKEIHFFIPEIMIIFLTAYSDKEMIGLAIESDAFAYLLKPYRDKEILATLELAKAKLEVNRTKLEKYMEEKNSTVRLVDGYIYDKKLNRLFLNHKEVVLGSKALKLIQFLCKNKHITLEIDTILEEIWDSPKNGQTLRSLIHRIREATSNNLIQNTNKFGYRIGLKE